VTDIASQDVPGGFDAPSGAASHGIGGPAGGGGGHGGGGNFDLPSFSKVLGNVPAGAIDLLKDVDLNVKIELGRTKMLIEDVLKLAEGSVVELDKLAGDPVDVFVNDQLVARGEVLVLNDNFCVRINEIITTLEE
jgi:flagellar motor switch protein FliN/FliY